MGRGSGTALGCLFVFPAALVGMAGLADGAGPGGWRGFAEFLGWAVVCLGAGGGLGRLFAHGARGGIWAYAAAGLVATFSALLFYLAVDWLALGAPMVAKNAFTASLQVIGVGAVGAGAVAVIGALRP